MNIEEVKRVLEKWDDDSYEIIKKYTLENHEIDEKFVEHYLGKELYERLETTIVFVKQLESLKRDLS